MGFMGICRRGAVLTAPLFMQACAPRFARPLTASLRSAFCNVELTNEAVNGHHENFNVCSQNVQNDQNGMAKNTKNRPSQTSLCSLSVSSLSILLLNFAHPPIVEG